MISTTRRGQRVTNVDIKMYVIFLQAQIGLFLFAKALNCKKTFRATQVLFACCVV